MGITNCGEGERETQGSLDGRLFLIENAEGLKEAGCLLEDSL